MSAVLVESDIRTKSFFDLNSRIRAHSARCGVIGLGYVGLPLSIALCRAGYDVTGIDIDANRVRSINEGRSYVTDIRDESIGDALLQSRFRATFDLSVIGQLDAISICVPTPLRKTKDPDMSYVIAAANAIAKSMRPGQLVILESTTYPGATQELVLPALEASGLRVGADFFLAFSPERVDPGNKEFSTRTIPKVVGGVTARCTELAAALYGRVMANVVRVTSPRVAEMVKLLENTFRSINIALANEIALMCAHMRVDVWEVIKAASTKPFGFMPFYPGPGLGGHCIPIDPLYLEWKSKLDGFDSPFIALADKINSSMPRYVAQRVLELINERGKALRASHIHVLGVTYKKDIGDSRESPALEVIRYLLGFGARVTYSDPFVPSITIDGLTLTALDATPETLQSCDMALITTDHSEFDYDDIVQYAPLVFDTRNATDGIQAENLVRL
jgi:UDP-N-acetyl-D-glucosamine dehydrogenase